MIGAAPILVRFGDAGPAAVGFWRLVCSVPLLVVLARRSTGAVGRPTPLAALAGLAFALDLGFWHYGIANTSVAKATVLANLAPVVVTALAWIVLKQRPAGLFLVAVALAVTGASTLAVAEGVGPVGPNPLLGDGLSIATAFWYALYFIAVSAARQREAATRIMCWSSLTAAPLLYAAGVLLGEQIWFLTQMYARFSPRRVRHRSGKTPQICPCPVRSGAVVCRSVDGRLRGPALGGGPARRQPDQTQAADSMALTWRRTVKASGTRPRLSPTFYARAEPSLTVQPPWSWQPRHDSAVCCGRTFREPATALQIRAVFFSHVSH